MPFKPGISGNPAGRTPGSKNKAQAEVRELIEEIFKENREEIKAAFEKLEGRDKVRAATELLPYIVPKMQSVSNSINWEDLTEEQLDEIIERLKNSGNG